MTTNLDPAISHLSPVWSHYTTIVAMRGAGALLYDADDRPYLDFTCGIGVTNTGHCHPRVVAAIREQAGRLLHGQANIVFHPPMLALVSTCVSGRSLLRSSQISPAIELSPRNGSPLRVMINAS